MLLRVVVVAAGPYRELLERAITAAGADVALACDGAALLDRLAHETFDLAVLRQRDVPGFSTEVVTGVRALPDGPGVVVLADREDAEERSALLGAGCLAVVFEGLREASLQGALRSVLERYREAREHRLRAAATPMPTLDDDATTSPAMRACLELARRVAATDSTVLILGETGVGKEWLARALHHESARSGSPFLPVNCGAVPEALLESEFFGHEKGAFTGASRARRGLFELAHRGTLFLDEIADLPLHLQVKLLRALEDHRIRPVGSEKTVEVDVRAVAATNRDLEEELEAGRFRPDLFYRLNVVTLRIPPLRERREEIPQLLRTAIGQFRARLRSQVEGIRPEAVQVLVDYDWPGNVRELINLAERLVLVCSGPEIEVDDLPDTVRRGALGSRPPKLPLGWLPDESWLEQPWRMARVQVVEAAERRYLASWLERCGGRVGEVARRAGLDPRSLFDKMKRHGLRKEDFRRPGG